MKSLFDRDDRESTQRRLAALRPDSAGQWGKMSVSQMLCHCARALETGTGDRPMKHSFIGKVLGPFARKSGLGEKPFSRNSPTDPAFVVKDEPEFAAERDRLLALIERFASNGVDHAGRQMHSFFGKLSGDEWGCLMYKHIDHHLQQFGG